MTKSLVPQLIPSKSDSKGDQDHPDEQQPSKVQCHVCAGTNLTHVWLTMCSVYVLFMKTGYLKVTIIRRYIFLRFWLKTPFASTKFCDLYTEMVQGQQIL